MIQRPQTLLLLQSIFLSIALLFVPSYKALLNTGEIGVALTPLHESAVTSTMGHMAAVLINFLGLTLATICIFLYKRRELQVKLCYLLLVLWLVVAGMTAFCPFVAPADILVSLSTTWFGPIISVVGAWAAFMAARFIKKDINLLKSADRIR